LVTACEDYKIRTFTRDVARIDDGEAYKEFENELKAAAMGGSNIELDKLPSVSQLKTMKGKKDGEIRVFKNGTNPEAYCWKDAQGGWEKIGDVMMPAGGGGGAAGGSGETKYYEGDRIF